MKRVIVTILMLSVVLPVSAQLVGRVFYDSNSNGVYDSGERPAVLVRVSDGKNVVTTDKNGVYTLEGHNAQKFISLTSPSGFTPTLKHYLSVVEGKTSGYDFGLEVAPVSVAKDGSHTFIHITDTEISGLDGHQKWVDGVRSYASDQSASFVIHTGDICYEKGLDAHIELMNDSNMGLPVRYCIGNHDYVKGEYGEQLFEKLYGPIYYSFDVGNTHYVVTPMPYGDYKPGFSQDVFSEWLANDLKMMREGQTLVIFNHDLVCRDENFKLSNVELLKHNLKAWIYGHWHINHVKRLGNIPTICSSADKGGIDHSAATFRRIDVDKNGDVTSQLIYPYVGSALTIAECSRKQDVTLISVNGYHTESPIVEVVASYIADGKKREKALSATTDWNWRAELPLNAQNIKVSARCNSGQTVVKQVLPIADSAFNMVWSSNVGSNIYMSSPIINGDNIYVGCVDESLSGKAGIACVDAKSGKQRWIYKTRNSIKNTIATAAGKVFAQDAEGYLYAVSGDNGDLLWEQKLTVADPLPSIVEGLAVHGDKLYAGTGKGLTALDFDGNVVWRNNGWSQNEGTTSTFAFTDSMVLTGSQWQALFANDLKTGKMEWRADRDGLRFRASTPLVSGGIIYVLSQKSLFILDHKTGKVIMRKDLPYDVQISSQPLLTDKAIIFGTTDAGIRALDIHTFEPLWDVQTGAGLIYTSPYQLDPVQNIESSPMLTSKGNVIIGTADGVVRVIDPKEGKVLRSVEIGAPILTTFLINDKDCYVADYAGNIYQFTTSL